MLQAIFLIDLVFSWLHYIEPKLKEARNVVFIIGYGRAAIDIVLLIWRFYAVETRDLRKREKIFCGLLFFKSEHRIALMRFKWQKFFILLLAISRAEDQEEIVYQSEDRKPCIIRGISDKSDLRRVKRVLEDYQEKEQILSELEGDYSEIKFEEGEGDNPDILYLLKPKTAKQISIKINGSVAIQKALESATQHLLQDNQAAQRKAEIEDTLGGMGIYKIISYSESFSGIPGSDQRQILIMIKHAGAAKHRIVIHNEDTKIKAEELVHCIPKKPMRWIGWLGFETENFAAKSLIPLMVLRYLKESGYPDAKVEALEQRINIEDNTIDHPLLISEGTICMIRSIKIEVDKKLPGDLQRRLKSLPAIQYLNKQKSYPLSDMVVYSVTTEIRECCTFVNLNCVDIELEHVASKEKERDCYSLVFKVKLSPESKKMDVKINYRSNLEINKYASKLGFSMLSGDPLCSDKKLIEYLGKKYEAEVQADGQRLLFDKKKEPGARTVSIQNLNLIATGEHFFMDESKLRIMCNMIKLSRGLYGISERIVPNWTTNAIGSFARLIGLSADLNTSPGNVADVSEFTRNWFDWSGPLMYSLSTVFGYDPTIEPIRVEFEQKLSDSCRLKIKSCVSEELTRDSLGQIMRNMSGITIDDKTPLLLFWMLLAGCKRCATGPNRGPQAEMNNFIKSMGKTNITWENTQKILGGIQSTLSVGLELARNTYQPTTVNSGIFNVIAADGKKVLGDRTFFMPNEMNLGFKVRVKKQPQYEDSSWDFEFGNSTNFANISGYREHEQKDGTYSKYVNNKMTARFKWKKKPKKSPFEEINLELGCGTILGRGNIFNNFKPEEVSKRFYQIGPYEKGYPLGGRQFVELSFGVRIKKIIIGACVTSCVNSGLNPASSLSVYADSSNALTDLIKSAQVLGILGARINGIDIILNIPLLRIGDSIEKTLTIE